MVDSVSLGLSGYSWHIHSCVHLVCCSSCWTTALISLKSTQRGRVGAVGDGRRPWYATGLTRSRLGVVSVSLSDFGQVIQVAKESRAQGHSGKGEGESVNEESRHRVRSASLGPVCSESPCSAESCPLALYHALSSLSHRLCGHCHHSSSLHSTTIALSHKPCTTVPSHSYRTCTVVLPRSAGRLAIDKDRSRRTALAHASLLSSSSWPLCSRY